MVGLGLKQMLLPIVAVLAAISASAFGVGSGGSTGPSTSIASSAAAAAASSAISAPSPPPLSVVTAAFERLVSFYNFSSGLFGSEEYYVPFWTTANQLEAISNYAILSGRVSAVAPILSNSLVALRPRYCNCWRDDVLWFVLAWSRAFEATGNVSYLTEAQGLYADIVGPWQAWNTSCGGMNWENNVPYLNAITNELFLSASMRLHNLTAGGPYDPGRVSNFTYIEWARVEWQWLNGSGIYQPSLGIFLDGLGSAGGAEGCAALGPVGSYWTYNQGVLATGLALLAAADSGSAAGLVDFAHAVAAAAVAYFGGADGILKETSCGSADGTCGGGDGTGRQFKGAFIRHVAYGAAAAKATNPAFFAWAVGAIDAQVQSILSNDAGAGAAYGQLWQGPYGEDLSPWVSQGCALDAMLASMLLADVAK